MSHSILPPSSAGIWGKEGGCTGWILMNQTYPETESSIDSRKGEAAHEIGAQIITDAQTNKAPHHSVGDWEGITASNGVVFDSEMFESAKMYADDVIAVMRKTGVFAGDNIRIEQRVDIPQVHAENWGTPDCSIYHKNTNTLYVWDFKHGFDVVDAYENWQAINYAAGLLDLHKIDGYLDQKTKVVIRIVQPRAFHREGPVREWVVMASDLRPYTNTLHSNAHKALGTDAEFNTGDHCKHCPGRHACPAALKAGIRLFEAASAPTPVEMSPDALGVQLSIIKRACKQLECLESGFTEQVESIIKTGVNVPGWTVQEKQSREKWNVDHNEVVKMGDMLGFDLRKPTQAITPSQTRKLGVDESVIKAYSIKPRTGLELVPHNLNKAKQVFKK